MSKVMKYISQDKKTLYEQDGRQYKLLSGKDCCAENNGANAQTQGYVGADAQSKVVRNRSLDLDDILYLAKTVEDLVNPYPQGENQKQKTSKPIRKKEKIKRRTQSKDYDDEWDMEI